MLPEEIWTHIYSFGPEHRPLYQTVMGELHTVTKYWYLKFLKQPTMTSVLTRFTRSQVIDLAEFWNNRFTQMYAFVNSEEWVTNGCCTEVEFLCDTKGWKVHWSSLQANIVSSKIVLKY